MPPVVVASESGSERLLDSREQHLLHDAHPDTVALTTLRSDVKASLDSSEESLRIKFPSWFRRFTDHACLYMQTTNSTRLFALCNEAAEAFRDHFRAYMPWLEKPFYYSMWGLTIAYLIVRNLMVAIRGGGMALAKTAVHDLCSEAIIPPFIVQWSNRVQDGFSKKLLGIKRASLMGKAIHMFRPFSSMFFGSKVMKYLDKFMVNIIPKIFAKVPTTMATGINNLVRDIGASLAKKLF